MKSRIDPPILDIWDEPMSFANRDARNQKNHNWYVLRQYGADLGLWIKGYIDGYDARFDNLIRSVKQPDEVVDARVDAFNTTYPTLKKRIDALQLDKASKIDGFEVNDLRTIQLRDISETSSPLRIGNKRNYQGKSTNALAEGLMICSVSRLSLKEVVKVD
ncbi:alpha-amylase [Ligilactobacillus murinus]|uniref:Alpha-amylase n=1 Tax=Ligilactobacillus murinus TaxID=1622 RepID=A0AAE6WGT6_9LACO|nr:alpha-amylase [Ligilactobacillus murinus]NEF82819.1 alpha-amylase [Ligilactobacillus murinus]NEF85550.1 alpha-amylase [Ligilactobacillus murinus]NEF87405.1 alpha-amylase [Ligilactobacillus murinus]NEF89704.1 alpha-amylase [Ligilactobacillus murinus]NEF91992.1 alpha-amylase [Ligilactobacillus murinus]